MRTFLKTLAASLAILAGGALGGTLLQPDVAQARELRVEGPIALAGDSVRFRAQFVTPNVQLDSITLRWSLTGNSNQLRTIVPPPLATITDAAIFVAPGVPGGQTLAGNLVVTTWLGGSNTPVVKQYNVNAPDTGPVPAVTGLVLLDSAVVINP